jgi:hypothetical protein
MKNLLYISLVALPLCFLPSKAHAWGCGSGNCLGPANVDFGFNWHYNFRWGCNCQAGPWYSYWPYEAHFQGVGAPVRCGFPGWAPQGAAGPVGAPTEKLGQPSGVQPTTPMPSIAPPKPGIQPTAYSPQAPAYWYGR